MKRAAIGLLAAICLVSCGKDNAQLTGDSLTPARGQFVCRTDNITAAVGNRTSISVTIFVDGSYRYQQLSGRATGSGSSVTYDFGELNLICDYSAPDTFTAVVFANSTGVDLPAKMVFKFDNTVLDQNGDGVLDSLQ